MQSRLGARGGLLMLFLFVSANILSGQSDPSVDKSQISKLLIGLSDHSLRPADVLDPAMNPEKRKSSLEYFDDPSYQLSLVPVGAIEINADGSAAVPVKVHFKNENNEVGVQSTIEFVKRNQVWYFANFGFVAFPTVIIGGIVVAVLVAISYASGVLLLRRKLLREGKLDWATKAKIFIPVFWPSLFKS